MKIDQINIHKVLLPFSSDFSHARKKGTSAKNVIVEVIADQGRIKGYGEAAPRPYVTGESQESVIEGLTHFVEKDSFPWELDNVSQLWNFVDKLSDGKARNSAICAIEMSLLDALGREQGQSVIAYFPKNFYTNSVYYGASIPLSNKERIMELCQLIGNMGISDLRLKMGRDLEQNTRAIQTVKLMSGDSYDLRIDVNGAWDRDIAFKHIPLIDAYKVKIVEQPMMPDDPDFAEFAEALQDHSAILMADESACSLGEVERITEEGYYKMVNVRLSKCGGLRNSLGIIQYLRRKGVSFQIGCQLGESGLLSAAGRTLSLLCRDAVYHDGSYDDFVLRENITVENISFGPNGKAGPLEGPGLGVEVNRPSLERLSTDCINVKGRNLVGLGIRNELRPKLFFLEKKAQTHS